MTQLIIGIVVFIVAILILRALGAWMLRIDEVIKGLQANNTYLKGIHEELKKANKDRLTE